jgi:predicted acylesterase/phospholipase RssA
VVEQAGAYGAGVLTGLTLAGSRPRFEVVTGVSTGALIAPFAFLGPEWDEKLREAYGGGATGNLLQSARRRSPLGCRRVRRQAAARTRGTLRYR